MQSNVVISCSVTITYKMTIFREIPILCIFTYVLYFQYSTIIHYKYLQIIGWSYMVTICTLFTDCHYKLQIFTEIHWILHIKFVHLEKHNWSPLILLRLSLILLLNDDLPVIWDHLMLPYILLPHKLHQ